MSDLFLFRSALRDLFRPKKLITALCLIAFPTVVALLFRLGNGGDNFNAVEAYNQIASNMIFQFIMVILALVFCTSIITQEVEQKTIVYLLTRPVPRWRILLVKFAGAFVITTMTAWLATVLLSVACFSAAKSYEPYVIRLDQVRDSKQLMSQFKQTPDPYLLAIYKKIPAEQIRRRRAFGRNRNTPNVQQVQNVLETYDESKRPTNEELAAVVSGVNRVLRREDLLANKDAMATLNERSAELQKRIAAKPTGIERSLVQRAYLQELMPDVLELPKPIVNPFLHDILILPVAVLAYGSLFLLLATLFNRPLITGLMFSFGWETWVPQMPGNFQKLSLMSYVKVLAPHEMPSQGSGNQGSLVADTSAAVITAQQAWMTLSVFTVVALVLALVLFTKREYVPRDDT
ncbi:MAG: ABC transporter permease subunit [Armatimonadetes bacterium]|nr:ABC transporter permease subunit [Armatimonadota bacterium]